MKLKGLIALLLCVVLLTGCSSNSVGSTNDNGEPVNLGHFKAETLEGETITEEYFADAKLTMINVWATFCNPCQREMPELGDLHRDTEDFQVLGIVTDVIDQDGTANKDQVQVAKDLVKASNVTYPSLILNESLASIGFADLPSVPTTIFVDSKGNIVGDLLVGAYSGDDWKKIIEERMGEL